MNRTTWSHTGKTGFDVEERDGKLFDLDGQELPFFVAGVDEVEIAFSCDGYHEDARLAPDPGDSYPEERDEEFDLVKAHALIGTEKVTLSEEVQEALFCHFLEEIEKFEED